MTFDQWWKSEYGESFNSMPRIAKLAFEEIAQKAWNAAREGTILSEHAEKES